jgi:hypothetical protein
MSERMSDSDSARDTTAVAAAAAVSMEKLLRQLDQKRRARIAAEESARAAEKRVCALCAAGSL